jgi:hypothetical protein
VDQALQIAVTVYEAEAEVKRNLAFFFQIPKTKGNVEASSVNPKRP